MKRSKNNRTLSILFAFVIALATAYLANAQTTAFTYQGRLTDNSTAANGSYDMQFALYNAASGGAQLGPINLVSGVSVVNGVFTVSLNFGEDTYTAPSLYLEIGIRSPGNPNYTPLSPRQPITSVPLAIQSRNALKAADAEQLGGADAANYLQKNGSGAQLTNLNAANITSGTLDSARLANLDAGKITTGTFADARLSANVALRNQNNSFTGNQFFNGSLAQTGATADLNLTDGFLARGTYGTGAIPTTGAGARIMFYSRKAAFRAGYAGADEWDDAKVGNFSTALGAGTTASGGSSTALGNGTTASGSFSTAMGYNTRASGNYSTAMGYGTSASGLYSTALGYNSNAYGNHSIAMGYYANIPINGSGSFVFADASSNEYVDSNESNQFVVRAQHLWLGKTNPPTFSNSNRYIETSTGAYLSTGGTWTNSSSVKLKTNFAPVDSRLVLQKVLRLPLTTWNYKTEDASVVHLGAMAQDFRQAFNLGADEEHISTVDADGVALAAIQGLNAELKDELKTRDARIESLQKQISDQQTALEELKRLVCAGNQNAAVCRPEEK